jgi:predicted Zn-dependent peptidase
LHSFTGSLFHLLTHPLPIDLAELPNGVRVVTIRLPHLATASASVFVRSGSAHEGRLESGISHFVEHMAFKGTRERDARRINLDAERLGAEVNAHTDKDHTAYHMRGLAEHAPRFVQMLGDIVCHSVFPEAEVERERQVLLQEFAEDDDDPMSTAYKLFDRCCFGEHPAAQPVIGTRRCIERIGREQLAGYVQRHYTGENVIVAVAGAVDHDALAREAERAFGALPRGAPNLTGTPDYAGDVRTRRLEGSSQTHFVLGFPLPPLAAGDARAVMAAALLGEGMSSPLMHELREERGLLYYGACSADVLDICGQFVIEASTAPEQFEPCLDATLGLLALHAERIDPVDLERARNQVAVRELRRLERPHRLLEDAALDLFARGRARTPEVRLAERRAVSAAELRALFESMLELGPSMGVSGRVARGCRDRSRQRFESLAA